MSPPKGYNYNAVASEMLPQLVKALTDFADDDENFLRCEQYAWSTIKNHRYLSTNSHDVRRRIKGMYEKFRVDNQAEYAEYFDRMCQTLIEHPLCVNHYEVDVQWSVLDFLLTLAYNPTGALRRNKYEIEIEEPEEPEPEKSEHSELESIKIALKEDFIPITREQCDTDSDLSDWSDTDDTVPKATTTKVPTAEPHDDTQSQNENCTENSSFSTFFPGIRPPERTPYFRTIDDNDAELKLRQSIQNDWWLPSAKTKQTPIRSTKMEANYALLHHNFMNERSNNLLRREPPSTVPEYCLMREVLWMFHSPLKCKFFDYDESGELRVRDNVTIPSLTVKGLRNFLEGHFVPQISMMHTLREFIDAINKCDDFVIPKTVEIYTVNLNLLLQPFRHMILDYEKRLIEQRFADICTVIQLEAELRDSFRMLESLYSIHQQCVLNVRQSHAHISSAYLLTSLLHCNAIASTAMEANLAVSLFVTAVKTFCTIIDTWWTEGRLDDWQQEFLVQSKSDHSVRLRLYRKDKQKAFFVPTHVGKIITESKFFNLLLQHTLDAGYTLNLLYEINRISDLKTTCSVIKGKLYNVFVEDVLKQIHTMQAQVNANCSSEKSSPSANVSTTTIGCQTDGDSLDGDDVTDDTTYANQMSAKSATSTISATTSVITTTDVFLLSMFKMSSPAAAESDEPDGATSKGAGECDDMNALQFFEQCQRGQSTILPLEEIILNSLSRILQSRIASANSFVVDLYFNEFTLLTHLANIRKVLLLEASDIMHQFYCKLFKQIESGNEWAFPFILTMQLDDILNTKYPSMTTLFRLKINSTFRCNTDKVFEAIDEVAVTYNYGNELSYVITERDIDEYNHVFRLLLKIKWGLMTLESLQFPQLHKRRNPFTPFEMIDLLMRRLQQLRFWMMYAIQSIHFHLMAHVLQPMSVKLEEKIVKCRNLKEMQEMHKSYIRTICEQCFLRDDLSAIKLGVEQLLNLTFILRMEWNSCIQFIDNNSSPLTTDIDDDTQQSETSSVGNCVVNSQIDAFELTYIRCHQYLANKLNNEVYLHKKAFLTGLSDAFNTSLPH